MNEAEVASLARVVALGAFVIGAVFGAVANRTQFCTMGAVSDWVSMGDLGRLRMWFLAIAVAVLGANGLQLAGAIDLSRSLYTGATFHWLSHLVGGLAFGVGMTLASGCGSKTLIRIGGGNLKSVVVFVFLAISAYMTLRGLFGAFRVGVLEKVAVDLPGGQDLPSLLASATGAGGRSLAAAVSLVVAAGMLAFAYGNREFRSTREYSLGGIVVGLTVVAGWYLSGHVGRVAEHPETLAEAFVATNTGRMESLAFVAPAAFTLEYLLFWTDKTRIVTFGIASAAGVVAGAWFHAWRSGTFRWESFRDAADMGRHMLGGALMGFGGVTALGCTIGQGVTGFSTLALGSMVTFVAMLAGAAATMKWEYARMMRE